MIIEDLNPHDYPTTQIIESNILVLYQRLKLVEANWIYAGGSEFVCNSGLRSQKQQQALIAAGKSLAVMSKHLLGCAADIADDGPLKDWLKANPNILETASLWCEAAEYTPSWVHFQIVPPGSGHRWFIP